MDVLRAVETGLEDLGLRSSGERLVVGVSGGADSVCLLDSLHRLGVPVVVAHFDHALRPGSWADGRHVLRLAARLGVPAVAQRVDPGRLRAEKGSLEDIARRARYRFLGDVARQSGCGTLAVGHTQDDQAETVLLHLLRGAGAQGLRAMQPATSLRRVTGREADHGLRLIRPLLGVPRQATEAYCRARRLVFRRDPTNAETCFARNRIRSELLPLLATYNPAIRETLARTADILAAEAEASEALLGAFAPALILPLADGRLAVEADDLRALPVGLQRLVLRAILQRLSLEGAEVGFEAVERARRAAESGTRTSLPGNLQMQAHGRRRVFGQAQNDNAPDGLHPQLPGADPLSVVPPCSLSLAGGWRLEAAVDSCTPAHRQARPDPRWEVLVDADASSPAFLVDTPRPGDRMTPFGASGSKKLSDVLQHQKIPPAARAQWPVLRQGGAVVWLVGVRRSDGARLGPATRRIIRFRLMGPKPEK